MKPRKFIALCAVLATLVTCAIPSHAEEQGGSVVTGVSSTTTIGGGVDTSATWNSQTLKRGWVRAWLRFFVISYYLRH